MLFKSEKNEKIQIVVFGTTSDKIGRPSVKSTYSWDTPIHLRRSL